MNERIRQLAEQAEKEVWGHSRYNGWPEFEGYELDAEKFAKLIVRECATVADHWVMFDEGPLQYGPVGEKIKEHFGVKDE